MSFCKFRQANFQKLLIIILISAFILPNFLSFAQQTEMAPLGERKVLEEELKKLEEQLSKIEEDISKTEKEKRTLKNQIYLLKKKIEKLDLQIQESNVMIRDISLQISDTEASITKTSLKIENSRQMLSAILRKIYEEDQKSLIEILLSEKTLSGFFDNLMALESLNLKSQEILGQIKNLKSYLENQKMALDEEKTDLERILKIQILQRQESRTAKKEKDYFLKLTETQYQKYLKEKEAIEKRAAEIRARIFELIGIPEAPTFGQAYELAKYVEGITGVRPAFLLAVLTQESNIGKNVGQCFLVNPTTGEGQKVKTGEKQPGVMAPGPPYHRKRNDVKYFLEITKELGRDPYNTVVSCPINDPRLGLIPGKTSWGGAMGPAQFIPTTWAEPGSSPTGISYKERIKAITGSADPWDIKDAFLAAALYLKDYGATSQNPNDEWRAAMIYFSGTTNLRYRFYGDSVLRIAKELEEDIKAIELGGLTQI